MIYKITKDFNHITSDNKILVLKEGTAIDRKEGDFYIIKQGRQKELTIPAALVEANPDYFEKVDLYNQLHMLIKKSKAGTAPKKAKEIVEFLENDYLKGKDLVEEELLAIALDACRLQFIETEDSKWLKPIQLLGWDVDSNGVFKK